MNPFCIKLGIYEIISCLPKRSSCLKSGWRRDADAVRDFSTETEKAASDIYGPDNGRVHVLNVDSIHYVGENQSSRIVLPRANSRFVT